MTSAHVFVRDGSLVHETFEWGFAEYEKETSATVITYPIAEGQWSKFQRKFGVSQFQRVNYFENTEPIRDSLEEVGIRLTESQQQIPDNEQGTLQIAGTVKVDSRLYVLISRQYTVEGNERDEIVAVAVFRSNSDVVAIRVNTDERADSVYNLLRQGLQWEVESDTSQKPSFEPEFRTQFGEQLAEAYTQVWFRDESAEEVKTIHFQGAGDLRESETVSDYFGEYELYAGYVRIQARPDTKFYFNWREHRISFRGETEESEIVEASNQILSVLES